MLWLMLVVEVALTQVQRGFVEHHELPLALLLKPVYIPLDGTSSLWCVDCTPQLIVISRLAEGALHPTVSVTD